MFFISLRHSVAAPVLCSVVLAGPVATSAQDPDLPHVREAVLRHIESIEPRAGPPGTQVRVASVEMPMITPIWVGIGASRLGFEAFHNLMTGMDGKFAVDVEVPQWARWDRPHTFIAFDIYFRPMALSDPFHVTNEDGLVRRTGRVREASDGCLGLRDQDDIRYALEGVPPNAAAVGDTVVVEGRIVLESRCGIPQAIVVTSIEQGGGG
jgi:hypothetical protein